MRSLTMAEERDWRVEREGIEGSSRGSRRRHCDMGDVWEDRELRGGAGLSEVGLASPLGEGRRDEER